MLRPATDRQFQVVGHTDNVPPYWGEHRHTTNVSIVSFPFSIERLQILCPAGTACSTNASSWPEMSPNDASIDESTSANICSSVSPE